MTGSWTYMLTRRSHRQLQRLSENDQQRILSALDRMIANPFEGDVRKLSGRSGDYRIRVGQYRAIFQIDSSDQVVYETSIVRRPDAYR